MEIIMETKIQNRNRTKRVIALLLSVLVLIILTLAVIVVILTVKLQKSDDDNATLAAFAEAVPEYRYPESTDVVTIDDAYLGEISIPALENVPRAAYDYSKLNMENEWYVYGKDGTSAVGVDVSYYAEDIDWERVKADGIDFAMIRVGYRGYAEGVIKEDRRFEEYINGAIDAGLDVGVYFYSQAINEAEALEEAEFVLQKIKPYILTYPVALDIEITEAEGVRANNLSGEMLNTIAETFCDRIKEDGYRPMVYANKRMAYLKLDMRRICKYDFWYAEYTKDTPPSFYYDFRIWQYKTDGKVAGISGNVDINLCFRDYNMHINE
jgi:GH25 family lysozyme M1 (1,4-beta-N-acetylmuramidase)